MSYSVVSSGFILNHNSNPVTLFKDLGNRPTPNDIEALVASGDLFAVLATELDAAALSLIQSPGVDVSAKLDNLTEILLYLQRHYKINRKSSDYRQ